MKKIGYVISHPIQYQDPFIGSLSSIHGANFEAIFLSDLSAREYFDEEFSVNVSWDSSLKYKYNYRFLATRQNHLHFFSGFKFLELLNIYREKSIFVFHGWSYGASLFLMMLCALRRKAYAIRGETWNFGSRRKSILRDILLRFLIKRASVNFCIGGRNRDFYLQMGSSKSQLRFAGYGVDNSFFYRAKKFVPAKHVRFLLVSKLIERKRVPQIVTQFIQTATQMPGISLSVVGDGPEMNSLTMVASGSKNIKILGFKTQSELIETYHENDVLLLHTSDEPWGLVANEAMASGMVVSVGNQVGCARNLVLHKYNGFVMDNYEQNTFNECIEYFCSADLSILRQRAEVIVASYDASFVGRVVGRHLSAI